MVFIFIIVIFVLFAIIVAAKNNQKRFFAFLCSKCCSGCNKSLKPHKIELFKHLNQEASRVGPYKFKVLEIGGGSGTNYEFINTPVEWTVTEPNICFASYFKENVAKFGGKHRIGDLVAASGEDLGKFESDSFDAVIISLVLCSVTDMSATLKEIRRVLRKGGNFYFIEHVGAKRGTWMRSGQNLLTNSMLWKWIGDGCEANRDTEEMIRKAGFSKCQFTHYKTKGIMFYLMSTQMYGRATKGTLQVQFINKICDVTPSSKVAVICNGAINSF